MPLGAAISTSPLMKSMTICSDWVPPDQSDAAAVVATGGPIMLAHPWHRQRANYQRHRFRILVGYESRGRPTSNMTS